MEGSIRGLLAVTLFVGFAGINVHSATLKEAVEGAEVIRSFDIGNTSVGEVKIGGDCVVLGLQQEDSSTVAAFNLAGQNCSYPMSVRMARRS